jgi:restriction system protein
MTKLRESMGRDRSVQLRGLAMRAETGHLIVSGAGVAVGSGTAAARAEVTGQSNVTLDAVTSRASGIVIPAFTLGAVLQTGERVPDGVIIECVQSPWLELIQHFTRNPAAMSQVDSRQMEEIVAGALREDGFDVVLTHRSADNGRDAIATRRGAYPMRMLVQVKRYRADRPVDANDVRALVAVMLSDPKATNALFTTTSTFAPGIGSDPSIAQYLATAEQAGRLSLMNGEGMAEWFQRLVTSKLGAA